MPDPVALIGGTGRSGPGLALRLALAGTPVVIGSRQAEKAEQAAADVRAAVDAAGGGAEVTGFANADAAERAPVAMITIPHEGQAGLLPGLAGALAGKVVVSTAVPVVWHPELGPLWVDLPEGSAADQAAALLPGARIAAGFHTLSSAVLGNLARRLDAHVVVTGDDAEAKRTTMAIAERLPGIRAVDGGPLRYARHSEQLTVLLLSINRVYKRHTGVMITNLPAV